MFIYLSADASPQGGLEYYVVLEDCISRRAAGALVEATDAEREQWIKAGFLSTTTLPVSVLGSGNASAASKFEALTHAVVLDAMHGGSPASVADYSSSTISFCSDFGTEAAISNLPHVSVQDVLKNNVKGSNGLLILKNEIASHRFQPVDDGLGEIIEDVEVVEDVIVHDPEVHKTEDTSYFGMLGSLMVPGVKHMFDNVHKELIASLSYYPTFSATKTKNAKSFVLLLIAFVLDNLGFRFPSFAHFVCVTVLWDL